MDSNDVITISTQTNRTLNYNGSFAKRHTETVQTIPKSCGLAEELYLRTLQFAKETISVYQALYMFDGAIEKETYNSLIEDVNNNLKELENRFKIDSYILVIVENGEIVDTRLFQSKSIVEEFISNRLNTTLDDISSNNIFAIPDKYRGTKVFKQNWIMNREELFSCLKQGT